MENLPALVKLHTSKSRIFSSLSHIIYSILTVGILRAQGERACRIFLRLKIRNAFLHVLYPPSFIWVKSNKLMCRCAHSIVVTCIATICQYCCHNIMSLIHWCADSIKVIAHNGITGRIFMKETKENNFFSYDIICHQPSWLIWQKVKGAHVHMQS